MIVFRPGDVVHRIYVGHGGCEEVRSWTIHGSRPRRRKRRQPCECKGWKAICKLPRRIPEWRDKAEAISAFHPRSALDRGPLGMPVGVDFCFINNIWPYEIGPRELQGVAGTVASIRIYWKRSAEVGKGPEGTVDAHKVVQITEIDGLLFIQVFIHANDVFTNVQGAGQTERQVIARRRGR